MSAMIYITKYSINTSNIDLYSNFISGFTLQNILLILLTYWNDQIPYTIYITKYSINTYATQETLMKQMNLHYKIFY